MIENQYELALIPHKEEGVSIDQRADDGYINATAMCKAAKKEFKHYNENKATKEFLKELSLDVGIPTTELVHSIQGGNPRLQGTWVHPDVAIHLAQWLSPKFAVQVSKWVREWLSGGQFGGTSIPYHLRRYMANRSQIPYTHFSILNELMFHLIAPLEAEGYTLPDHMLPDISEGKMFCKWLRDEKDVDTDSLPTYRHTYADGRIVNAKMYPNSLLGDFKKHFFEAWLPKKAVEYFKGRDIAALPYIEKALLAKPDLKVVK